MPWAPNYIEPDVLADFVHTDVETDRVELEGACSSASRAVDLATYRQFGVTTSQARIYTPEWNIKMGRWVVECDDFTALTAIAVDLADDGAYATAVDLSGAVYLPHNAPQEGRVYERVALRRSALASSTLLEGSVRLTALWGWEDGFPDGIVQATKLQASRFFARRNSPYGIAGSPEQGSEIRLQAKADPDVLVQIRSYKRAVWLS